MIRNYRENPEVLFSSEDVPNFSPHDFLASFHVSAKRGFLPIMNPQDTSLAKYDFFSEFYEISKNFSELVSSNQIREKVDKMKPFSKDQITNIFENFEKELNEERKKPLEERILFSECGRMFSILVFIENAYVWGDHSEDQPKKKIPKPLSTLIWNFANLFKTPAILCHFATVINNFKLKNISKNIKNDNEEIESDSDMKVENLDVIQSFTSTESELWFWIITMEIECAFGPALYYSILLIRSLQKGDHENSEIYLTKISNNIEKLKKILNRMSEKCDPKIFYGKVRHYLRGWGSPEEMENGMIYEGENNEKGQFFHGGSAAQSCIFQFLDTVFNIEHKSRFMSDMRNYILQDHRDLINLISNNFKILNFLKTKKEIDLYNEILKKLIDFRSLHIQIAFRYVTQQNIMSKGTAGTELMPFLKKLREDCSKKIILENEKD